MIMLLLLIPALCISISLYVMLLINFIISGNCVVASKVSVGDITTGRKPARGSRVNSMKIRGP